MKPINRVAEIIQDKKLSVSHFERQINAANGTISTALRKESSLKDETLNKILEVFPEIGAEWLLTGRGIQYKTGEKLETLKCDEFIRIEQLIANEVLKVLRPRFVEIQESNQENKINLGKINTNLNIISSDLKTKHELLEKMRKNWTENQHPI